MTRDLTRQYKGKIWSEIVHETSAENVFFVVGVWMVFFSPLFFVFPPPVNDPPQRQQHRSPPDHILHNEESEIINARARAIIPLHKVSDVGTASFFFFFSCQKHFFFFPLKTTAVLFPLTLMQRFSRKLSPALMKPAYF